jgi:hypothetical protein
MRLVTARQLHDGSSPRMVGTSRNGEHLSLGRGVALALLLRKSLTNVNWPSPTKPLISEQSKPHKPKQSLQRRATMT